MRKLIFLILLSFSLYHVSAEEIEKHEVYCEIVHFKGISKSVTIYLDEEKYNIQKNGSEIKLKSATEAMRLLSEKGWKLRSAFGISSGNGLTPCEFHYIMAKEVFDDKEMFEGLVLK